MGYAVPLGCSGVVMGQSPGVGGRFGRRDSVSEVVAPGCINDGCGEPCGRERLTTRLQTPISICQTLKFQHLAAQWRLTCGSGGASVTRAVAAQWAFTESPWSQAAPAASSSDSSSWSGHGGCIDGLG